MLLIAICGVEDIICCELESMILNYAEKTEIELEVLRYPSETKLCEAVLSGCRFDLVFLDIELHKMSGFKVGEKIRSQLRNEIIQIVFVSSKQGYAMELFDVRPLHFLLKPLKEKCVTNVIEKMIEINDCFNKYYEFQVGEKDCKIMLRKILYFEGHNKRIHLVSENGGFVFFGKMADVFKKLDRRQFLRIHQYHIVNNLYVEKYRYDSVMMVTGEVFPIGQPYRKAVCQWHMNTRRGHCF